MTHGMVLQLPSLSDTEEVCGSNPSQGYFLAQGFFKIRLICDILDTQVDVSLVSYSVETELAHQRGR